MSEVIKNHRSVSKRDTQEDVSGWGRSGRVPLDPQNVVCGPAAWASLELVRDAESQPPPRPLSQSAFSQDAQVIRVHTAVSGSQVQPSLSGEVKKEFCCL